MIAQGLSAAGRMLNLTGDGPGLQQQVQDETEEMRKKRMQEAQQRGYSPAGSALAGMGVLSI